MNVAIPAVLFKHVKIVNLATKDSGTVFFDFGSYLIGNNTVESRVHLTGTKAQRVEMLREWAHAEGYVLQQVPDLEVA